jgi:hypothetical protein
VRRIRDVWQTHGLDRVEKESKDIDKQGRSLKILTSIECADARTGNIGQPNNGQHCVRQSTHNMACDKTKHGQARHGQDKAAKTKHAQHSPEKEANVPQA